MFFLYVDWLIRCDVTCIMSIDRGISHPIRDLLGDGRSADVLPGSWHRTVYGGRRHIGLETLSGTHGYVLYGIDMCIDDCIA
mgnify:CR=1 FL=1